MAMVLAGLALVLGGARAATAADCGQADIAYLGTDGSRIRALRFDACAGRLGAVTPAAEVDKPRWIVPHARLPLVYAAIDGSGKEGRVIAYAFDRASAALTRVNEVTAGGGGTTHLWLDTASMTLLAANFASGSVSSIAVNQNGSLGARLATLQATGSGPHRRQASAHAHGGAIDPSGRYALVADMGADRVFVYGFDRTTGALSPDDASPPRTFATVAGSGPRRAIFGASGRFVYVLNELSAQVLVLRWDPQDGRLTQVQSLAISSPEFQGSKSASEIAVSRDGRFIYVADRGENALLAYRVHPEAGTLSLLQRLPSGGEAPWAFDIHPSGKWMLVANYRSNRMNLFGIDLQSGRLTDTAQAAESPSPVSVSFIP
ncbi:6-phosphogluconolactonase [Ramlibacter tataouinensis]|uniref:6-phosphogluconolactonase n=1 Tax=Ramlibacter tataouinensis TaxID=94132 RepID=A0A127JZG8_9BURK|nr:6-phosphogluconolactonase [Ramlibacter tataouinensis]